MSIQDLQQNPLDTSNFYLANIYQTLADPNGSNTSTSSPSSPPPFSPPNHAVWVNALWFLSLIISLTCALLATLLQQWARRYLKITQSRYSPHKRARIRAFFAEGVEKRLLPWTVDALPTLLHISLFLFFAGLVVFLCNINLTIFKLVLSWVGLCVALYGCITCMPIICHDSPYYTPLSLPTWHIVTGTLFFIYRFLRRFNWSVYHSFWRFGDPAISCRKSLVRGMQKTAEETALSSSSKIDTRAFMWTFDCLDEDHELERFFSGLPGFCSSKVVKDPLPSLTEEEILKLYWALHGLLVRTFSSDLLSAHIKKRRALICAKAVDPKHVPFNTTFRILDPILFTYQYSGPVATSIAKVLRGWGNNMDQDNIVYAQSTICKVLATSQPRDDSWYNIASDELGFPETSLRDYAAQGDSLSLVILIHVVRQQFTHFRKRSLTQKLDFSIVLSKASEFDARDTSLELQHKFCILWNQIVNEAQGGGDWYMAYYILRQIRNVFLALHQDTDCAPTQFSASTGDWDNILENPFSYPVCEVLDHRSDTTPHNHDDGVSVTLARTIPHDLKNTALFPSNTSPDPPPSSRHTPLPVFTDALPLHSQISVPVSTQLEVIGQPTTEGRSIPTISLSPVIEPSRMTMSTPPMSNASASPPADIAILRSAPSRAFWDDLNVRSSPTPVLDAILPTDLSIPATTAEGQGSAKDASHSTLGAREEVTATADIPPQLLSLAPVSDVAIDDPSKRSLGTEHIEQRPPYAIVVEHSAFSHTLSNDVEVPSSPTPILKDFLPIGTLLSLDSAVTLSDHLSLFLESHS